MELTDRVCGTLVGWCGAHQYSLACRHKPPQVILTPALKREKTDLSESWLFILVLIHVNNIIAAHIKQKMFNVPTSCFKWSVQACLLLKVDPTQRPYDEFELYCKSNQLPLVAKWLLYILCANHYYMYNKQSNSSWSLKSEIFKLAVGKMDPMSDCLGCPNKMHFHCQPEYCNSEIAQAYSFSSCCLYCDTLCLCCWVSSVSSKWDSHLTVGIVCLFLFTCNVCCCQLIAIFWVSVWCPGGIFLWVNVDWGYVLAVLPFQLLMNQITNWLSSLDSKVCRWPQSPQIIRQCSFKCLHFS